MNTVQKLAELGQSIWYDTLSRHIIQGGELKKRVDEGLLGVTSNPTIFDKAISGSTDYDGQVRELLQANPNMSVDAIIRALMVKDIQTGADVLRTAFDRTEGLDGYISVEVNPNLARNTGATEEEVRQFSSLIGRKNLMIKIPATKEGLPAIEQSISEGININVTLIFSVERYREVADAYLRGLERRVKAGKPIQDIVSVASIFVSRVDTLVDDLLQKKIAAAGKSPEAERLRGYLGRAAVANAKIVYQTFKEIFSQPRFAALKKNGANIQRPLWGSTGTKNPAYSDLLYVETLIGRDTVNTVPPSTYQALLDHGKAKLTVEEGLNEARELLRDLASAGVDMSWVMKKLEDDGVAAFEKSFDGLRKNLQAKRDEFLGRLAGQKSGSGVPA
jgi:transaldolase